MKLVICDILLTVPSCSYAKSYTLIVYTYFMLCDLHSRVSDFGIVAVSPSCISVRQQFTVYIIVET